MKVSLHIGKMTLIEVQNTAQNKPIQYIWVYMVWYSKATWTHHKFPFWFKTRTKAKTTSDAKQSTMSVKNNVSGSGLVLYELQIFIMTERDSWTSFLLVHCHPQGFVSNIQTSSQYEITANCQTK